MSSVVAEVFHSHRINRMARAYDTLLYTGDLIRLLSEVQPGVDYAALPKRVLHEQINQILFQYYKGEEVLKYALFQTFAARKNISAFEIRVNSSRADFVSINGYSSSFEIKSDLDNLSKLQKQAADYQHVFEYNYLVVHPRHVEKAKALIPDCFGIWSFSGKRKKVHRPAILNQELNPDMQLRLLTKRERQTFFKPYGDQIACILASCSPKQINQIFKEALKKRYWTRWHFLLEHQSSILPIDVQFFFNANIHPSIIYKVT